MKVLVTGGAGFIGSNLIRYLIQHTDHDVLNLDKLTYAGNLESLADIANHERYDFRQLDITETDAIGRLFDAYQPDWIMHLAAESHVDRSIDGPGAFIQTNIVGTFNLLQAARRHYERLEGQQKDNFRFLHVSTDEVYGSLSNDDPAFSETTNYDPHSPYSASKASSDHLARAWQDTYGLPVLITNCSNNYGPYQFPEKLIPVVILKAISGQSIPIYGKGENIRDWLFVGDHASALTTVISRGRIGETYNIGGNNEIRNIDLVQTLCKILDDVYPAAENEQLKDSANPNINSYADLIAFVSDRPGHDLRYAIDASKIKAALNWEPTADVEHGFRQTVAWYLNNRSWWERILSGDYRLERQGTL